jgi:arylsulfatase A-like enzyme
MSMITGLYPHAHGITHNVSKVDYPDITSPPTEEGIKSTDVTTESILHESGYDTHHFGKWHLSDDPLPYYPDMFGEHREYAVEMTGIFDSVRRGPREGWMDWYGWALPVEISTPVSEAGERVKDDSLWCRRWAEFVLKMGRLDLPLDRTFDYRVADKTIECLESERDGPFMVTCSFNSPHDPNVVPSPFYEMYDPDRLRLPDNSGNIEERFEDDWSRRIVADLGEDVLREFLRIYLASVSMVDSQVGRIMQCLEELGTLEDTLIVFTSDHGDMVGGHGMVWKSTHAFYDEVIGVPLIIANAPDLEPGTCSGLIGSLDLMPTILGLIDHGIPHGIQGRDFTSYLRGESGNLPKEHVFCERVPSGPQHRRFGTARRPGSFMVRGNRWKYILFPDGDEYLYDLLEDPQENENLARSDRPRAKSLREILHKWQVSTGYGVSS